MFSGHRRESSNGAASSREAAPSFSCLYPITEGNIVSNEIRQSCPDCGGDLHGNPGDWIRYCPHCDVYVRFPSLIELSAMFAVSMPERAGA